MSGAAGDADSLPALPQQRINPSCLLCIVFLCIKDSASCFIELVPKGRDWLLLAVFPTGMDNSHIGVVVLMPGLCSPPGDLEPGLYGAELAASQPLHTPKAMRELDLLSSPADTGAFSASPAPAAPGRWL